MSRTGLAAVADHQAQVQAETESLSEGRRIVAETGEPDVVALLDRLARGLASGTSERIQTEVTAQAVAEIPGTQMASLSITHVNGHMDSVAATHPTAARCDGLRDQFREGPCRDVAIEHRIVTVDDLGTDDRYPTYGPEAAALGVRSELAVDVFIAGDSVMALNLYSDEVAAFKDSRQLAQAFASHVAVAIGFAEQATDMSKSAATRGQIGQAMGLVMERYGLNEARAFGFLVRLSQTQNIKVRDIAASLVNRHNEDHPD